MIMRSEYKVQVSKLGVENKVHFFSDFIPENKVNLFFSACDMVVQPYKSATQSGVAQIAYHLINLYWLQMLVDFLKLCLTKKLVMLLMLILML